MHKRSPLPVGTVLQGRYRIINQLGAGGMGAVYEAYNERTSSAVALKETFATDDYLISAFEREAKLLANLDHEAFPRVTDYFTESDGYFLVMELIRGKDLAAMLEENGKPFDVATVLNWADQILDALEDLHSQGIVHRDIKPANIKLNQRGKIKLIDFGIAKGTAGDLTKVSTIAAATGNFAPLEQVLRADENAFQMLCIGFFDKTNDILQQGTDARSDIYSLGATVYQLLTNKFPAGVSTRALSVWSGHADKLIPVHQLNPQVPREISEVLWQAMAIERGSRISTANEMRGGLRQAVKVEPAKPAQYTIPLVTPPTVPAVIPRAEIPRLPKENSWKNSNKLVVSGIAIALAVPLIFLFLVFNLQIVPNLLNGNTSSINKTANTAASSSNPPTLKNSIGMEFVKIPSGSFNMGSNDRDDEKPIHKVTISKDFYLGKYEVTQAQWKAVMGNNSSNFKGDNLPVEQVSWEDAQDFIKKLNEKGEGKYRLPTEAEWEYAARAGSATTYSYGDDKGSLGDYAWYQANSDSKTHETGTKKANGFGLYDMSGNVWEWCQDWYGEYPSGSVTDPRGATSGSGRVVRGGCWYDVATFLRSANRNNNTPSFRNGDLGFRLLRE